MDVSEMSAEQVRREIAERYYNVTLYECSDGLYYALYPDGSYFGSDIFEERAQNIIDGYREAKNNNVPDWPNDAEAALALCLEIAQFEYTLHLEHGHHADGHVRVCVAFYEWDDNTDEQFGAFVAAGDTPALALSRLALLALREQEGRGVSA